MENDLVKQMNRVANIMSTYMVSVFAICSFLTDQKLIELDRNDVSKKIIARRR